MSDPPTQPTNADEREARWAQARRLFTLEEPAARWRRQVDQFRRERRRVSGRPAREKTPGSDVDRMMAKLYGAGSGAGAVLNLMLAVEDARRFTGRAFDDWLAALEPAAGPAQAGADGLLRSVAGLLSANGYGESDRAAAEALCRWLPATAASGPGAALWAVRSYLYGPDWQFVKEDGPWSSDPRAEFVAGLLDEPAACGLDRLPACRQLFLAELERARPRLPGSFLPRLIVLVEGPTEELLIPYFARLAALDLDAGAVMVKGSGGAKQVVRRYRALASCTSLPVLIVLDADAGEQAAVLASSLRAGDRIHVLSGGEIEDVFDDATLLRLVNEHLRGSKHAWPVAASELSVPQRRTETLNRLWRERGLGDFDKTGFARTIVAVPDRRVAVPADLRVIFSTMSALLQAEG